MTAASQAEKNVFGAGAQVHPVTGMALESGIGALPADVQAANQCAYIEEAYGKKAGAAMRAKLAAYMQLKTDEKAALAAHIPLP